MHLPHRVQLDDLGQSLGFAPADQLRLIADPLDQSKPRLRLPPTSPSAPPGTPSAPPPLIGDDSAEPAPDAHERGSAGASQDSTAEGSAERESAEQDSGERDSEKGDPAAGGAVPSIGAVEVGSTVRGSSKEA